MKKYIALWITGILLLSNLAACSSAGNGASSGTSGDEDTISIVTTIFPEYDWVKEVLGDQAGNTEVTMLLDNGVDLHSYQPTVMDIAKIATCDLFIYVGGESDKWAEDALAESTNPDMKVINLMEVLGDTVKEEEIVEGMEAEDEDDHGDESGKQEDDEEEIEYDEHVWLSLRNAETIVRAIADAIVELDEENASVYQANAEGYIKQLQALDAEYQEAVNNGTKNTILFGDRFPFRYLTDDYHINYYAAFVGCSAETEASFETVVFLADKIDELNLHTVLTIEGTDHRIAETIIENTKSKDQVVLSLNSMQGTTSEDVEEGATYLSIMEENLEVLKEALK
ncbi:MAG: zinc ABC transporter substrate-binding protein [Lachnospiraceae bacterium]|nr:zinc ABC transporter substrate-binding protein [Lachnospiraceae bacterium]MBR1567743.1 zinc ABC transporter substrate-binding protein [Lachnospiraceae bacterium]